MSTAPPGTPGDDATPSPGTAREVPATWADRAADRSPSVQRSRTRSFRHAKVIVEAAHRLIRVKGSGFTTQELAKEAGVALQTFYRHFASKDQLLLAVFEDELTAGSARIEAVARELPDPVSRLRLYVTSALGSMHEQDGGIGPQFITAEHWRLHQLFPEEMAQANQSYADLIERELREAADLGLLRPANPASDAWFAMKLIMSVYHHYAFAAVPESVEDIAERLWKFCLAAFNSGAADAADAAAGAEGPGGPASGAP